MNRRYSAGVTGERLFTISMMRRITSNAGRIGVHVWTTTALSSCASPGEHNSTELSSVTPVARKCVVLAALSGMSRLDYQLLADALSVRRRDLKQMDTSEVQSVLGDMPGAVGPFQDGNTTIVVDSSLVQLDTVHCGSGRPDRTIEISGNALGDLAKLITPLTAPRQPDDSADSA
jgi:hypothetical protein